MIKARSAVIHYVDDRLSYPRRPNPASVTAKRHPMVAYQKLLKTAEDPFSPAAITREEFSGRGNRLTRSSATAQRAATYRRHTGATMSDGAPILGIDPGITGGIATLWPDGRI